MTVLALLIEAGLPMALVLSMSKCHNAGWNAGTNRLELCRPVQQPSWGFSGPALQPQVIWEQTSHTF
jgi:hypothetical protein